MDDHEKHTLSEWIRSRTAELGFDACGISEACRLEEDKARLEEWLLNGYHGEMAYMEAHREKRTDPALLVENARSVITLLMNYFPEKELPVESGYRISRYAYGKDYHLVIREKLNRLIAEIETKAPGMHARGFTDSAPVLDRAWAVRAGLGWIGKNTCLIHPKLGSYVFIGEIITDLELDWDTGRVYDLCGGCNRCIEKCPTGALVSPRILDSNKCISYLTIEYRGELPGEMRKAFGNWIFGCDICQEVCPWNRKSLPHKQEELHLSALLAGMKESDWESLDENAFRGLFKDSAVRRTKFNGLKRNIDFLLSEEDQ